MSPEADAVIRATGATMTRARRMIEKPLLWRLTPAQVAALRTLPMFASAGPAENLWGVPFDVGSGSPHLLCESGGMYPVEG